MRPLDLAALWRETIADTRALLPLALPVAAAFVLLPGVAVDLFGPPLPLTLAALTPRVALVHSLLPALVGLIAQVAIVQLALDRRRRQARSVGEALLTALRLWPAALAATLVAALAIVPGIMLLVLPGLYAAGRLSLLLPLVVEGNGPVAAAQASWARTAGNGWRALAFMLLFVGWFVIVAAVAALVGAGLAALVGGTAQAGAGTVVASALQGLVAAVFTVLNAVAATALYRALVPSPGD